MRRRHTGEGIVLTLLVACGSDERTFVVLDGSCETPTPLVLEVDEARTVFGQLSARRPDGPVCAGGDLDAAAATLSFALAERKEVWATVSSERAVQVGLQSPCGTPAAACGASFRGQLEPGTHTLVVAGPADAPFGLSLVTLDVEPDETDDLPPNPIPIGACARPEPVLLNPGRSIDLEVDWTAPQVTEEAVCDFFRERPTRTFELDAGRDRALRIIGTSGTEVEVLLDGCNEQPTCSSCCGELSETPAEDLVLPRLPAGPVLLRVVNTAELERSIVRVVAEPPIPVPPNDRCTQALPIDLEGESRIAIDTSGLQTGPSNQCLDQSLFYRFDLPAATRVQALASQGNLSFTLRDSLCNPIPGLSCRSGVACIEPIAPLAAGPYVLEVSKRAGFPFRAEVQLRTDASAPPPPNDACEDAAAVSVADSVQRVETSLDGAGTEGAFAAEAPNGRDAWVRLDAVVRSDIVLMGAGVEIYAGADCTDVGPRLPEQVFGFGPGSLLVRVFEDQRPCGASAPLFFDVFGFPTPPPPANDRCANPETLASDGLVRITGSMAGAFDDYATLNCDVGSLGPVGGYDVVYRLVLDRPTRIQLESLQPAAIVASLHRSCDSESALACTRFGGDTLSDTGVVVEPGEVFLRFDVEIDDARAIPPPDYDVLLIAEEP
jgi:hypothetical protein